jgi:uncharacterized membrane protein
MLVILGLAVCLISLLFVTNTTYWWIGSAGLMVGAYLMYKGHEKEE